MILSIEDARKVYKGAMICDGAVICKGAMICECAMICDGAVICKDAVIRKGAMICECAMICDGAEICEGAEGIVLHGAYRYSAGAYYDSRKKQIVIRLGCFHRSIKEWDSDFDNNTGEFPLESPQRRKRWNTYQFLKTWAMENLNEKT